MLNKWCSVSKKTLNSVATVRAKEGNKAAWTSCLERHRSYGETGPSQRIMHFPWKLGKGLKATPLQRAFRGTESGRSYSWLGNPDWCWRKHQNLSQWKHWGAVETFQGLSTDLTGYEHGIL